MYTITTERPEDGPQIENLLDQSFGPLRHEKTSYRYRDGVAPIHSLGLVARAEGQIVGTVRYWPVDLAGAPPSIAPLLLGPLAVDPFYRSQGIGLHLMHTSLDMAAWAGHPLAVLVGALDYYAKAGFTPADRFGITMPDEDPGRVLVKVLQTGTTTVPSGPVLPWRFVRRDGEGAGLTKRLGVAA
jgi:predicted N-acetyltransferase YhbS